MPLMYIPLYFERLIMNIHVILKSLWLVINFSTSTFFIPLVHNKWHITQVIFIDTISIEGLLVFS